MTAKRQPTPRSIAIPKSWETLDWPSVFAAIIYPALGIAGIALAVTLGLSLEAVTLHWWYAPLAVGVGALTLFVCNAGIGVLHRVWQHRAGELKWPAQLITAFNVLVAMQGRMTDWVNYHSQHHRLSDKAGDPHNPAEGIGWAWIGWLLWRDPNDMKRPLAMWLRDIRVVTFTDRHYLKLTLFIHLVVPAIMYAAVWAMGGSLILAFLLHASAVVARGLQFHATVLGVNVFGHLKTPLWFDYVLALLSGGEALHDHHHDEPKSALHLPKRGVWNRIVDYNGTVLLAFKKLGMARDLIISTQFLPARARTAAVAAE